MLDEDNHIHPDFDILKVIAKKAYEVAKVFEEKGMNEELIIKYLNNQLPCDALCEFGLTTSVLCPDEVPIADRIYSCSHKEWLNSLNRTKLQWTWKQTDIELEETQGVKLKKVLDNYKKLQQLALSYKYE
jgi:hypothetical protein